MVRRSYGKVDGHKERRKKEASQIPEGKKEGKTGKKEGKIDSALFNVRNNGMLF